MPMTQNPDGTIRIDGDDGAQWIVEGVRSKRYHVIDRWSPKDNYRLACLYLLKLSRIRVNDADIY